MVTVTANNCIQLIKNDHLINIDSGRTRLYNPVLSEYDIFDIDKINKINPTTNDYLKNTNIDNSILNGIISQLGDLSILATNTSLAILIYDKLINVSKPAIPTNGISSESLTFDDIQFNDKTISGVIEWEIPNDLTNITHFEGFLSIDNVGVQRELTNIFLVKSNLNRVEIDDVFIGTNLYILIYTKNILKQDDVGLLQSTNPCYMLINDLYETELSSVTFNPFDSLYNVLNGILHWTYTTQAYNKSNGVNVYFSHNGVTKNKIIELNVNKSITRLDITNSPFNKSLQNYILIYMYKSVNGIIYENPNYESIEINNRYQPTDIIPTSVNFMGDLNQTPGFISGTLYWEYILPKDSIDGVEIYITSFDASLSSVITRLLTTITNNYVTSYSIDSLNIQVPDPNDELNITLTKKFILRTYNEYSVNTRMAAKLILDV